MALAIPLDLGGCEVSRKGHPSWHHYSLEYRFLVTGCLRVLISSPLVLGGDREGGDCGAVETAMWEQKGGGAIPFLLLITEGRQGGSQCSGESSQPSAWELPWSC